MRYWEIKKARNNVLNEGTNSEPLICFQFEIACKRWGTINQRWEEFEESGEATVYTQNDWIKAQYRNIAGFFKEYDLEPKYPVTRGEYWEKFDGTLEACPDDYLFDKILPGYVHDGERIKEYKSIKRFEDIERLFYLPYSVENDYLDWSNGKFTEEFEEWSGVKRQTSVTLRDAMTLLQKRTGLTITIHNSPFPQWHINDGFIGEPSGFVLVSPRMSHSEAIPALHKVLGAIADPLSTNSTTGLRVHVSVPNPDNIDLLKLALFLEEEHVLNSFHSKKYERAHSLMDLIKSYAVTSTDYQSIIDELNSHLKSKANYLRTVDVRTLKDGYLVFNMTGGSGYEKHTAEIISLLDRYIRVIELASDPMAERESYLEKLFALFSEKDDDRSEPEEKIGPKFISLEDLEKIFNGETKTGRKWSQRERELFQSAHDKMVARYGEPPEGQVYSLHFIKQNK